MHRSFAVVAGLAAVLALGACDDGDSDEDDSSASVAEGFDESADVWITAVVGGGNERLNPGGVEVELLAEDAAPFAQQAERGELVDRLTSGGATLECEAAFDGPSYRVTLHLADGDVVVGTCGEGIPLVDTPTTTVLLDLVNTALAGQ